MARGKSALQAATEMMPTASKGVTLTRPKIEAMIAADLDECERRLQVLQKWASEVGTANDCDNIASVREVIADVRSNYPA